MEQRTPDEFETKTAITVHTTIDRSIEANFPALSTEDRDALFVAILERLARMRGRALRGWYDEEP